MAKRKSLIDLQVRLAERLKAAKTEAAGVSWLALEAGGGRVLLPLVQSGEIFSWVNLQPVPYAKPWFVGVASLRGGLHGVIDLARLTGWDTAGRGVQDRVTSETRLLSLHAAMGVNAVLWVDRLVGLRNPSMFASVAEPPEQAPSWFSRRLTDHEGRTWQELDLMVLAADPAFLAIAV